MLLVALLAIAVATTPDEQHFVKFVQEYTQRGLGFLPGPLLNPLTSTLRAATLLNSLPNSCIIYMSCTYVPNGPTHPELHLCWCLGTSSHLSAGFPGAGFAASSLLWLQMKGGSGPVFWNARAFSIARRVYTPHCLLLQIWSECALPCLCRANRVVYVTFEQCAVKILHVETEVSPFLAGDSSTTSPKVHTFTCQAALTHRPGVAVTTPATSPRMALLELLKVANLAHSYKNSSNVISGNFAGSGSR